MNASRKTRRREWRREEERRGERRGREGLVLALAAPAAESFVNPLVLCVLLFLKKLTFLSHH